MWSWTLVGGRWLVTFPTGGKHRIAVFDLADGVRKPALWLKDHGSVYDLAVAAASEERFEILFVLNQLDERRAILCRFRWPTGEVEELAAYSQLRILKVDS